MSSLLSFIPNTFRALVHFLKGLGTKRKWVAVVLGVLIIGGVIYAFVVPQSEPEDVTSADERAVVTLISVTDFAQNARAQNLTNAGSEVTVRAETSGKIVAVVPVGARVATGNTIAQFENSAQQATLLQAEGSLDAAQASLEKTQGGLRSEKLAVLQTAFESAESGAVNTLLSAYATVDSAVQDTADQMFSNPESSVPRLAFKTSNSQRTTTVQNLRVSMSTILERQSQASLSISSNADLATELSVTETELRNVRIFIDELVSALNEAIATEGITESQITTFKASATSARTALTSALSSITSARATLETAEKNLEEGITGAEDTDLRAAAAAVKQAQGAYDAALSAYRKTIVRAPSSGTIFSCSASVGDVLNIGNDVCRIRSTGTSIDDIYALPLSSVKYTPAGAFVFIVSADGELESIPVETGLVTAQGISVAGLLGDEFIVKDVRGLKAGEVVRIQ